MINLFRQIFGEQQVEEFGCCYCQIDFSLMLECGGQIERYISEDEYGAPSSSGGMGA